MTGPLARRIADLEADLASAVDEMQAVENELSNAEAERDALAAANVELRDELHSLLGRARRYAGVLAEIHAWHWWHVDRACDSRWPACEATRWKAEQDAARGVEERGRG